MQTLTASDLTAFLKRFRFRGGVLRRIRIAQRGERTRVTLIATAKEIHGYGLSAEERTVRLRLVIDDAEEFRFQKRLNMKAGRLAIVRLAVFDGQFFVDFDGFDLGGEKPMAHDFRASNCYAVGRKVSWEEVEVPPPL